MRVLRVAQRLPPLPGGKEVHVAELTRRQQAMGDSVLLIFMDGEPLECGETAIRVSLPRWWRRSDGLLRTALFSLLAMRLAFRHRFDVLHVHGDFTEVAAFACVAGIRRVPLVVTVHGGLNRRYRSLMRLVFRAADVFIALGSQVAEELVSLGVPRAHVNVMSSGVDLRRLDAAALRAAPDPGLVVTVGSLDPVKNLETVVRAVAQLQATESVALEIIGGGAQEDYLKELARGSTNIRFVGNLNRDEVYQRVASASVFVLASRRLSTKGEGVSTALLEAMGLSRLCIVSTEATPQPVVADEGSYWLFNPLDVEALGALICRAVGSTEARLTMGRRARSAVEHLDWQLNASRVRQILLEAQVGGVHR